MVNQKIMSLLQAEANKEVIVRKSMYNLDTSRKFRKTVARLGLLI